MAATRLACIRASLGHLPGSMSEPATTGEHWKSPPAASVQEADGQLRAWRALRRLSLRHRIAAGVLAGLVILFSFFGFIAVHTINLTTDVMLEQRMRLAEITATSVDELLAHTARQLERTAASLAEVTSDARQQEQVAQVYQMLGEFDRIARLDAAGSVSWLVPEIAGEVAWPFEADAAVQAALRRTETSIFTPTRRIPGDDLIAILVTPLAPHDPSAGFLAAELRASHADVSLLTLPQGEGSFRSEIVDAAGYIVAQPEDDRLDLPDEHVGILGPMITAGEPGTTTHHVEDGDDHIVAYYPLSSLPGGVVVEQTQDAALAIPREMQQTLLVFGIVALLVASTVAWLHARSIVRPIRRLSLDAARMESGDLERPVTVSREDEIGELAQRFDAMRVRLRDSLAESARWAEQLERRVQDRTREVEERNRELNDLNRVRRQLLAKAISAQEEERKRLARELHDDSAQTVIAALMTLKTAEDALSAGRPQAGAMKALERSRSQLEMALREIRKAIIDLRPSALDDLGLAAAVRWYAGEHLHPLGVDVELAVVGDERRAAGTEATAVFRILQEAVNNVARHAGAQKARVILEFGAADVLAVVEDDGIGFEPDAIELSQETGRGFGLLGMRERAELFGGSVDIESGSGRGTAVRVRIPYA